MRPHRSGIRKGGQLISNYPKNESVFFSFSDDFCNYGSHGTVLPSLPVTINYLQDTQGKQHLLFLTKIALELFSFRLCEQTRRLTM